jgi:hypothetical protein
LFFSPYMTGMWTPRMPVNRDPETIAPPYKA